MEISGCMQKKKMENYKPNMFQLKWKIWNFDRGIGLYDSKK